MRRDGSGEDGSGARSIAAPIAAYCVRVGVWGLGLEFRVEGRGISASRLSETALSLCHENCHGGRMEVDAGLKEVGKRYNEVAKRV